MQRMDCQSQSQESEILPNNNLTNSFKDRDNQEAQMEQRGLEPLMCLHGLTVSKLNTKKNKKQTNKPDKVSIRFWRIPHTAKNVSLMKYFNFYHRMLHII